jgi:hypothetical protein
VQILKLESAKLDTGAGKTRTFPAFLRDQDISFEIIAIPF